jgi:hypothetical protein
MPVLFFDTSALQHRYLNGPKARAVRRAISSSNNECYVLELTVLEIASAISLHCRKAGLGPKVFDVKDRAFMKDLAEGRLRVRSATSSDISRARHLMRYAGVCKLRSLHSADALIAIGCLELALELRVPVTFWIDDWTLYSIIRGLDAFKAVSLRYLGRDKSVTLAAGS